MRSNPKAMLIIIRPFNVVLGGLSIMMSALIAGSFEAYNIVLACLSGMLIMAGGNVINDYFDIEVDTVNKTTRPLPSGEMSSAVALFFSTILFVLGVILSIFIDFKLFFVAIFVVYGLVLYSWRLKRALLIGNLTVSLFAAMAFIYGGMAAGSWTRVLIPAGFAFLFHLGREIIKDMEDSRADEVVSARTLPIVYGLQISLLAATCVFLLLIVVTVVPYWLGVYNKLYLWIVLFGVDFVIMGVVIGMWRHPTTHNFRRVAKILKFDMALGLLAVYLGSRV